MCEFCVQHGEGKKWYLEMKNYSRELLAKDGRLAYIEDTRAHFEATHSRWLTALDTVRDIPLVYSFVRRMATRHQKSGHWGQILPVEDVELVLDLQDSIVRLPCLCRSLLKGRTPRYCLGLGVDTSGMLGQYPDYADFEVIDKNEAKQLVHECDAEGLVHSVWTFKTPYIGGLCNCGEDCVAHRVQVKENLLQTMFRAEVVGVVNFDLCNGCKECIPKCRFGALGFSLAKGKAAIAAMKCYGCGVCRAFCSQEAISMVPRTDFKNLPW